MPGAIRDSVASVLRFGMDESLIVHWNGERFDARYDDDDIAGVEVPAVFRDGEEPQESAVRDAEPISANDSRAEELAKDMIDPSADQTGGEVELA
jgi:hypothetical protein